MGALYLSEILALCLFAVALILGLTAAGIWIHTKRRQWKWEDQVHQNAMRKGLMEELNIQYEVDEEGFVKPVIGQRRG